ncbi:MAG: hypothetical protein KGH75_00420 [Rhodospirillales bacterium]|nr:hypothetical protein [Rhodospirillales bacterium]
MSAEPVTATQAPCTVRRIEVLLIDALYGRGTTDDPVHRRTEVFTLDGEHIVTLPGTWRRS